MKKNLVVLALLLTPLNAFAAGQGISTWSAMVDSIADTDLFGITDTSDTTQSSSGSSKRITGTQLKSYLEVDAAGDLSVNSVSASLYTSTAANGSRVSLLPNNTVAYTVGTGETGLVNESNIIYQFLNGGSKYALLTTNSDANPVKEVDGHASGNLTAVQVQNTIIYNYGMGAADVALVLPTAAAGYSALFTVSTAQANKWGVQAGTNDKIYLLAADGTISAGSDNGYARMTAAQVGQSFACWAVKTDATTWDWQCKAIAIGTSTFAAN